MLGSLDHRTIELSGAVLRNDNVHNSACDLASDVILNDPNNVAASANAQALSAHGHMQVALTCTRTSYPMQGVHVQCVCGHVLAQLDHQAHAL